MESKHFDGNLRPDNVSSDLADDKLIVLTLIWRFINIKKPWLTQQTKHLLFPGTGGR